MEPLKHLLNQVQGQLNGMTLSQRLAIALCMVVLVLRKNGDQIPSLSRYE